MSDTMIKAALAELFRETFQGVAPGNSGTWFVQGKEAIFNSIGSLSSEEASRRVVGQPYSIGAHTVHLLYYLEHFNGHLRGENPKADWEGSWKRQEFSHVEWEEVARELQLAYAFTFDFYSGETMPEDQGQIIATIANIAHAAYHLGAIRALMPIVQAHVAP